MAVPVNLHLGVWFNEADSTLDTFQFLRKGMRSCKMNEIIKIFKVNFVSFVTGLIIILAAVAAFLKVTEPIITRIQQSVIRKKELGDQAATILKHTRMIDDIVKCLQELEDLSNHKDEEIASRLDKLIEMHIFSEIDHLR